MAALLAPYTRELTERQFEQLSDYLDLLLLWNARTNLTSVRNAEEIVTRHFGESLFAAAALLRPGDQLTVADVGSGAGFPGVPLKILRPTASVTLVEAHGKKATFLREVARKLALDGLRVLGERAEDVHEQFDVVAMRAVEHFEQVLPAAARLVRDGGTLGLMIGADQTGVAGELLPEFAWKEPFSTPNSENRMVFLGRKPERY